MPLYMDILNYIFNDETSEIKVLLFGHFLLTALAALGSMNSNVYLFYNFPLIVLLFWSILKRKALEPLRLVMGLEICLIILDIMYLVSQVVEAIQHKHLFIVPLSILLAFGQLIVRPFVIIYLLKINSIRENVGEDNDFDEPIEEITINNNPFELPAKS